MKIAGKLGSGFALVMAAMLAIAAVSLYLLTRLSQEWTQMSAVASKRSERMIKASTHLTNATLNFRYFIYRGGDYAERFAKELDAMDAELAAYRELGDVTSDERMMLEGAGTFSRQFRETMQDLVKKRSQKGADLATLDLTVQSDDKVLGSIMEKLTEMSNAETEKASLAITRLIDTGRRIVLGAAVAALLVAAIIAVSLARSITRPLAESVRVADRVAAGDLTAKLETDRTDEAGRLMMALQGMNSGLTRIVAEVRGGAHAIADSVSQLVAGHNDLSQRTEAQAASLEEASSSMEEFSSSVRQTADNAHKADQLAQGAAASAERGNHDMSSVVGNMNAISASSRKVAEITSVIDSIAFQTNILALNAAVEAARAGEQGRGFAVVATEVRGLAQRCAEAAKQIKGLIAEASRQIDDGAALVEGVSRTMAGIVTQAREVSAVVAEISAAAKEQSEGVGQVTQTVSQLEHVTQQNAALVEQASAATTALAEQAERLADAVSVFRLAQDGFASAAEPAPAEAERLVAPAPHALALAGSTG
ncbi:MAG: HAMP domain-containing protein [Betaproteobacteria bacterium]|nr:HAMP domain-containing protein [Betaproteobacteria bacterium]